MALPTIEKDFKEFLRLLNSNGVEYLLIGGYAVGVYGHIRATNDLDVWIGDSPENAERVDRALREFGFATATLTPELFRSPNMVRMGVPPLRIEILTALSGVEFEPCYSEKMMIELEGLKVPVISLAHLRQNKAASGRLKDLADLESLPE